VSRRQNAVVRFIVGNVLLVGRWCGAWSSAGAAALETRAQDHAGAESRSRVSIILRAGDRLLDPLRGHRPRASNLGPRAHRPPSSNLPTAVTTRLPYSEEERLSDHACSRGGDRRGASGCWLQKKPDGHGQSARAVDDFARDGLSAASASNIQRTFADGVLRSARRSRSRRRRRRARSPASLATGPASTSELAPQNSLVRRESSAGMGLARRDRG